MPSSVAVLDYFIVEANEYVDRLDNLVASAAQGGPDAESFGRYARALRGSATMSKQYGIADVAAALERVSRALRTRGASWDAATSGVVVAAIDDLRILIRGVRTWGADEERRAQSRSEELERVAPPVAAERATPATGTHAAGSGAFLASESAELARALDKLVAAPDDSAGLAAVGDRVRALRGVADLADMAPLPEVVDALERALKLISLGGGGGSLSARQKTLFAAAAVVLRRASRDIAVQGKPSTANPDLAPFHEAVSAMADESGRADRIVPIAQLFYEDAGPHVVSAATQPPTTAGERFRMEVVSLAEHLRRVVADARANRSPEGRDFHARELRAALRALGSAANSFGERLVARFSAEWSVKVPTLNEAQMVALDQAATLMTDPRTSTEDIKRGLERFAAPKTPQRPGTPVGASTPSSVTPSAGLAQPRAAAPSPRSPLRTPTGRELQAFLADGLSGLGPLEERPLSAPVPIPDEAVVPIEQLLYRGRSALRRAAELRDQLLNQAGPPSRDVVQELFDLLDLALAE
ncbi:MAG TPA: hypothetical protein VEI06_12350 [Gemmatimonadaceae bacterium]|nr:hypothetical protein [Gemmatimonadaceae bacterium]